MSAYNPSGGMRKRNSRGKRNKGKKMSSKKKITSGRKRTYKKRRSSKQKGGYSQYMSNVANAHIYSLGGNLPPSDSALASPPPYTPSNDCLNTWKHLGDIEPYNQIIA